MAKERNQRLVVGNTVTLRMNAFNGADYADLESIEEINIYKFFSLQETVENPQGKELVKTINGGDVTKDATGRYHVDVVLESLAFTQGHYQDVWNVKFDPDSPEQDSPFDFKISPDTWFLDSAPIVHDFSFRFMPNRIVQGSKKYLTIEITPNVPRGTDKQRYYENMITAADLYVSIAQKSGQDIPAENDLRTIFDEEPILERDHCFGYFLLDTTEMDCGIYDIWFRLNLGPNIFISDKQQLQIYS